METVLGIRFFHSATINEPKLTLKLRGRNKELALDRLSKEMTILETLVKNELRTLRIHQFHELPPYADLTNYYSNIKVLEVNCFVRKVTELFKLASQLPVLSTLELHGEMFNDWNQEFDNSIIIALIEPNPSIMAFTIKAGSHYFNLDSYPLKQKLRRTFQHVAHVCPRIYTIDMPSSVAQLFYCYFPSLNPQRGNENAHLYGGQQARVFAGSSNTSHAPSASSQGLGNNFNWQNGGRATMVPPPPPLIGRFASNGNERRSGYMNSQEAQRRQRKDNDDGESVVSWKSRYANLVAKHGVRRSNVASASTGRNQPSSSYRRKDSYTSHSDRRRRREREETDSDDSTKSTASSEDSQATRLLIRNRGRKSQTPRPSSSRRDDKRSRRH